jgi:UDP-N-acetylglucosamine 2-epimerase (non-hydrolysing)
VTSILLATPDAAPARDALAGHLNEMVERDLMPAGEGEGAERMAAAILAAEAMLEQVGPDALVLCGDGPEVAATALVAIKLGLPQARLGAGRRDGDRPRPAEIDGAVADRLCDLLLCDDGDALERLHGEGLGANAEVVGDAAADPEPAVIAIRAWLERVSAA